VQPCDQRPDLLTEHRRKRCRLRLHQDDVDAHAAQAGRHLAADEPGADDDGIARRARLAAQLQALVERPQHVDAQQVRERWNSLRHQARCDDQLVIGQFAAIGQCHRLRGGVDRPRGLAQQHRDVVLFVELRRLQRDVVGLAAQYFLGQRGPVVGQMLLVADDRDRSGVLGTA
jgi:hypothetical protein